MAMIGFSTGDLYGDVRSLARRKLSPAGFQFVDGLVRQAEDARALWDGASRKQDKALARFQDVELRHDQIERQVTDGRVEITSLADGNRLSRVVRLAEKDPTVIGIRRELADARAELEKQTAISGERGAIVQGHNQLFQRLIAYLDAAVETLKDAPFEKASRKADVSVVAIEAKRSEIAGLKAALAENAAAPVPSAERKAAAAEMIRALADRGIPELHDLAIGMPAFTLPSIAIIHTAVGAVPGTRDVVSTQGHVNVPDALSVLAWLFPTELQAAIAKEIDLVADDASAVTDDVRAARDVEIRAQILAAERDEEALVRAALSAGLSVMRRPGTDPRAVLGVTGPDPARL